MKLIQNKTLTESLTNCNNLQLVGVTVDIDNAFKDAYNIPCNQCKLNGKNLFHNSHGIVLDSCIMGKNSTVSFFNTENLIARYSVFDASTNFCNSNILTFINCSFNDAKELLTLCSHINMSDCVIYNSDTLCLNSTDIYIYNCNIVGQNAFEQSRNVVINNADITSDYSFKNAENVTLYNCRLYGNNLCEGMKNSSMYNCLIDSEMCFEKAKNITLYGCNGSMPYNSDVKIIEDKNE